MCSVNTYKCEVITGYMPNNHSYNYNYGFLVKPDDNSIISAI